jgi:hypothetical protein
MSANATQAAAVSDVIHGEEQEQEQEEEEEEDRTEDCQWYDREQAWAQLPGAELWAALAGDL